MYSILKIIIAIGFLTTNLLAQNLEVTVKGHDTKNISISERDAISFYLRIDEQESIGTHDLKPNEVGITYNGNKAKATDVIKLSEFYQITGRVVLVVDNSESMEQDIDVLQESVYNFVNSLGPGVEVAVVMFEENENMLKINNIREDNKLLNLSSFEFTSNIDKIMHFFNVRFRNHLTLRTYLNDAALYGLKLLKNTPRYIHKSIVFLSDGQNIGSTFSLDDALDYYEDDITVYTIDFNREKMANASIKEINDRIGDHWYVVHESKELIAQFENIARTISSAYVVYYKTLGSEESPLLNYVFYDENSFEIAKRYKLIASFDATYEFDETQTRSVLEKYYNILNIIGSRLRKIPSANLVITGCNSDSDKEKNNLFLSQRRAQSIYNYLTTVWNIDHHRMKIKSRNLPEHPSPTDRKAGIEENRRVEFSSDNPHILGPIRYNDDALVAETNSEFIEKYSLELFDFQSAEVTDKNDEILDLVKNIYLENPKTNLTIIGYSDNIGKEEFNKKLAENRAKSVLNALIERGIAEQDMTYMGYGEKHPAFDNDLPEGRFLNRNVRVYVKYPKYWIKDNLN